MPVIDAAALIEERVNAIRRYHRKVGLERAELDVSGGVDSAVMLALLSRAVGPEKITAVYSGINSSHESLMNARALEKTLGVHLCEINLTPAFQIIESYAEREASKIRESGDILQRLKNDPTIYGSLRSCLRAVAGRFMNRLTGNGLRHGTGNECEDRWLRFYQKGGDGEVDLNPIAMLSKGEVYQLAVALGIPSQIIDAIPSPDLHGNGSQHNDESELFELYHFPWTYSRVDEKGQYKNIGTIEIMSRLLDLEYESNEVIGAVTFDETLFNYGTVTDKMVGWAESHRSPNWPTIKTRTMLESCQRVERSTRHKVNPNIPTLGTRSKLIHCNMVTNELPSIG